MNVHTIQCSCLFSRAETLWRTTRGSVSFGCLWHVNARVNIPCVRLPPLLTIVSQSAIARAALPRLRNYTYARVIVSLFSAALAFLPTTDRTRLYLMGLKAPDFAAADNPAADASSWLTRTLTFLYLPSFNFYLLVFPRWLSFDWSMNAIPLIQSFVDIRNVATFVFYASLGSLLKACWNSMQNGAGQPAPSSSSSPSCLTCVYQPVASQHTRHQKPRSHAGHRHSTNNNSVCVCKELQLPCGAAGTGAYGTSLACDADETCSTSSSMLSTTSTSSTTRAYRSRCLESERLTFATSLLILPFLPATNLLFYVGFVVAERVLYIPRYVMRSELACCSHSCTLRRPSIC